MSPQKEPLAKTHALFYKGLKTVGENESKINVVCGKFRMSFFVGGAMARLEMSPKRKPLAKVHSLFYKGLKEVRGHESKIKCCFWENKVSFFV